MSWNGDHPAPAVGGEGRLPQPHGGRLVRQVISAEERDWAAAAAAELPCLVVDAATAADLEMICTGAYSPLTGFMGRDDYESVLESMRLAGGLPWTLPITLTVAEDQQDRLRLDKEVALVTAGGTPLGTLQVREVFRYNKGREAHYVYGTQDPGHPGVQALYRRGPLAVAGPVALIRRPPTAGDAYRLDPDQVRAAFTRRGWVQVVGFQTRNPVHRAHEYIQKCALETVDGLLLHPLTGPTRSEDVPAGVRMQSYEVMIRHYYPRGRVLLSAFPAPMRYAGPREAVFHALVRKNYGCSHFVVGRDHAGVGGFYGPYDSQVIFDRFPPGALGIEPLFFEHAFYCRVCEGMATLKTCPHEARFHVLLSGTRVREMLRAGKLPPPEFSRPEVARVLAGTLAEPGPDRTAPLGDRVQDAPGEGRPAESRSPAPEAEA